MRPTDLLVLLGVAAATLAAASGLIGLAVALALSVILVPLTAQAQSPDKLWRADINHGERLARIGTAGVVYEGGKLFSDG